MIDTHCHLTFRDFDGRVDQVLADAAAAGVRGAITVATTPPDGIAARSLAEAHPNVWFSAGLHPLYTDEAAFDPALLRDLGRHDKCVAWGELGLDRHYDKPPIDLQRRVLEEQLAFIESCAADGMRKPVIVHSRDTFDELIGAFRATSLPADRFVFHCFSGGPDEARRVLEFGAWISFTGIVTFANAQDVAAAAKIVPVDRIMVETDSPFLSPEPFRKIRPNEPKFVPHIANFIASIRGVDPHEFEQTLDANAERFFGIEATDEHG